MKDANFAATRRLQAYDTAADAAAGLVALGFGTTSEVYKAAVQV